jgi:hypothetical protein
MTESGIAAAVREVCALALLHWAAAWSGAAAAAGRGSAALCAHVAHFLERSLMLVYVPSALYVPRECWHAAEGHKEDVAAVWLEDNAETIEWTVVQRPHCSESALPFKLKIVADACNYFPQFPALRTLGDL